MRVTVLGMGRMGQAIALRLLADHDVAVWNRTPGKGADAVAAGARPADSLAEAVEGAEALVTSLATDEAVRAVLLADDSVRRLRTTALVADASTVSPALSAELAQAFDRFVATPVLGAPAALRDGSAVVLAGGAPPALAAASPLLDSLSATVHRFASAPLASVAKLSSNSLLLSGVVALSEAFALGRAGGLGDEDLRALFESSPLVAAGVANRFDAVLDGGGATWWTVELGAKDARLGADVARRAGTELPGLAATQQRYEEAGRAGHGEEDISAVSSLYAR